MKLLRAHLERYTAPDPQVPIVRIIVGDDNLSTEEARHALQRETEGDPLWEVIPALAEGRGDHVAVNGAAARFITIPVGVSFEDRGMRRDQHDAVAVMLSVRGASQPVESAAESSSTSPTSSRSSSPRKEPTDEADLVHNFMKQCWEDTYDSGYDEDLLSQLARLLFMKRRACGVG